MNMLGISSLVMGKTNARKLEAKDRNKKAAASATVRKSKAQIMVKRRLPYSFKEISTRLLQTKKSGNAQRVLLSAKQKAAVLRQMYKGGVYDDDEVFNALLHAQAISRVAKKRVKHLEEEERAEKRIEKDGENASEPCGAELEEKTEEAASRQAHKEQIGRERQQEKAKRDMQKMKQMMEQYERMMREAMKELEQLDDLEEFSDGMDIGGGISMDPGNLELMKKKHRADELREIMEADMKYLKFIFDKLEKEKQSNTAEKYMAITGNNADGGMSISSQGVSLELSGVDIPVEAAPDAMTIIEGGAVDAAV